MSGERLILASQSPRRHALLVEAGYAFDVMEPRPLAECGVCSHESPPELVVRLARQKASDVANRVTEGLIIGCDTVVECQGQILGKPHDARHARWMLSLLRGREHRVYSGLCLWRRPADQVQCGLAVTRLIMDPISDGELDTYLATRKWEGKAGAFGYQDGWDWIRILDGSDSNVVGLPLELLADMLADLNGPAP